MTWVETESLSFTARHETEDNDCAQRTLDRLEDLRLRLEDRFDEAPGGITVIIHPTPGWLAAAHPFLPAARLAAAPAGRRYLAGWAMASELHVLNDEYRTAAPPARTRWRRCAAPPSASTRRSCSPPTTSACRPPGARAGSPATCAGRG